MENKDQLENKGQPIDEIETAEDEDRNVSDLLITKSERAPTTQSSVPNVKGNRPTDFVRAAARTVLGALMMAAVYFIARSVNRSPKEDS